VRLQAKAALVEELVAACKGALTSLRAWNRISFTGDLEEKMWQLYRNSPEVKVIEAAIAKAEKAGGE